MRGFGPIHDCIINLHKIVSPDWFYGFLTRKEVLMLLHGQPAGTFLLRFSSSVAGSFVMDFNVDQGDGITTCHILIDSCKPEGYRVQEEDGTKWDMYAMQNVTDAGHSRL